MIAPRSPEPPLPEMIRQLAQHVRFRTGSAIADLRIDVGESHVTLHGRTHRYFVKQLASDAASSIGQGFFEIRNQIEVL